MQPKAHTDILEQALAAMPDTFSLWTFYDKALESGYPMSLIDEGNCHDWLRIYAYKMSDRGQAGTIWKKHIPQTESIWKKHIPLRTDIKEAIDLLERSGYVVSKKGCDRPVTINIKSLIGEANITPGDMDKSETVRYIDELIEALQDAVNDATRS